MPAELGFVAHADFDWGCDLFDHRHYWEAHEVFEAQWRQHDRASPEARFLQGLICAAAYLVKRHQGFEDAAAKILARCRAALADAVAASGQVILGIDVPRLLTDLERPGHWPVLSP